MTGAILAGIIVIIYLLREIDQSLSILVFNQKDKEPYDEMNDH